VKIVIVGFGWLGQQLAPELLAAGHNLYVTRRTAEALTNLPAGVEGRVLDLNQPVMAYEQMLDVFSEAIVICAISPGRQNNQQDYVLSLQHLADLMRLAKSQAVIHFSSSGIYQGLAGDIDESLPLKMQLPRVKLLADGEQCLQAFGRCITLRLAGLMGPGRHPGRFLAGKTLTDPQAPINMLHPFDIQAALLAILADNLVSSDVYNLSCPALVTRQHFYHLAMVSTNTALDSISHDTVYRRINPEKFMTRFSFKYHFPSACDALMYCK
jgi:nucleoside-diphosphate-sugar epimerase